jgi:ubiquitin-like modifier-activating enzyme ATG7
MPIVQFAPFSSTVSPSFWHALTDLKIDVLRLSDDALPVTATYTVGRSIKDRETGQEIALGCNLSVGDGAFDVSDGQKSCVASSFIGIRVLNRLSCSSPSLAPLVTSAIGVLKNYNTIEDFKAADKGTLFNVQADKVPRSSLGVVTQTD